MTENRRQFTRISFQSPARLFLADGEHAVEVLDISLKGALVRPPEPMYAKIGGNGVLHVRLDGAGTDIRMGVTVVHHQAGSYGLSCHEIDLDSVTHLRRLVELNAGDETLLEREIALLTRL
ncbi:PilZ domain-containing protein [Azonexus fungiphilus]|uniref:Cyclic diguanosine monophosphate-binding protein n=1 Tax=Azonexus fungiphilus TaxID=146940 RepID=A0A495VRG8_9RHOO|nr:PilZ domain-containing protein [Azonexus fungiphilus]RKT51257.1 PilZ domain-containing protein [Azonexus fungiphilus]